MPEPIACLLLSDDASNGISGILRDAMRREGAECALLRVPGSGAMDAVLEAYQALRARRKAVFAAGNACVQALALGAQLCPVRLALFRCPEFRGRLGRYAARNLALCSAEVLCIDPASRAEYALRRQLPHFGILRTGSPIESRPGAWTKCEFSVKNAICGFLLGGFESKSLAENAEMCIIYR